MRQPPVQGVQIAARVRSIRRCALDTTMTLQERRQTMRRQFEQARAMMEQYFYHFLQETEELER